ncbi:hypothetical protein ACOSQ3_023853 [Xanthoceras sorbifolium]
MQVLYLVKLLELFLWSLCVEAVTLEPFCVVEALPSIVESPKEAVNNASFISVLVEEIVNKPAGGQFGASTEEASVTSSSSIELFSIQSHQVDAGKEATSPKIKRWKRLAKGRVGTSGMNEV